MNKTRGTKLPDILELLEKLESEHQENEHLYRGQMIRYEPHRWEVDGDARETEALYPADYRFHYRQKDFSKENSEKNIRKISAARAYGRTVRDQFGLFLFVTISEAKNKEMWEWALRYFPELGDVANGNKSLLDSHFMRMAWSLAQHYFIATALTDLTFSTRVAAWFATEPWEADGKYPAPGKKGVIYRVHRSRIETILERATGISRALSIAYGAPLTPELFLVDIRDIPGGFARRPSAQQGASLYGLDQSHVIAAAMEDGAIEALEFRHRRGCDIGIGREDVVPAEDPFLAELEKFKTFQSVIRPESEGSDPEPGNNPSLLERANLAFKMRVVSAREVKKIRLSDHSQGIVYDEIKRRGDIEFRYMMLVEDTKLHTVVCAVTAERIKPFGDLPPEALDSYGIGQQIRLWKADGSVPLKYGKWDNVDEFIESASEAVRDVI